MELKLPSGGDWRRVVALFFAQHTKRRLEKGYDWLANTSLGKLLRDMPVPAKHLSESVVYVLNAILDEKFADSSAFKYFLNEIAKDSAPELMRRIINGQTVERLLDTATPADMGKIREIIAEELKKTLREERPITESQNKSQRESGSMDELLSSLNEKVTAKRAALAQERARKRQERRQR